MGQEWDESWGRGRSEVVEEGEFTVTRRGGAVGGSVGGLFDCAGRDGCDETVTRGKKKNQIMSVCACAGNVGGNLVDRMEAAYWNGMKEMAY